MNSDSLKNEVHVIPEICSKCKNYWKVYFSRNKIREFYCLCPTFDQNGIHFEIKSENNMFANGTWIKKCNIYAKQKKINENEFSFTFKPVVINDELKKALENVFFPDKEINKCFYYMEYQLSKWNDKNEP